MLIFLYIAAIAGANIITAHFAPFEYLGFVVPYGTFLIGLTFILRDLTQEQIGRKETYKVIVTAALVSAGTSLMLGDGLSIVFASVLAFMLSETTDTEIYTRLNLKMEYRVLYSGITGGVLDSAVFVVVGLSPLGINVLTWEQVPAAILGQVIIKTALQFLGASGVKAYRAAR